MTVTAFCVRAHNWRWRCLARVTVKFDSAMPRFQLPILHPPHSVCAHTNCFRPAGYHFLPPNPCALRSNLTATDDTHPSRSVFTGTSFLKVTFSSLQIVCRRLSRRAETANRYQQREAGRCPGWTAGSRTRCRRCSVRSESGNAQSRSGRKTGNLHGCQPAKPDRRAKKRDCQHSGRSESGPPGHGWRG